LCRHISFSIGVCAVQSHLSSNLRTSPVGRSADRARPSKPKDESPNQITRKFPFLSGAKLTRKAGSSIADICPMSFSGIPPFVSTVSLKTVCDFFHVQNLMNASFEEAIFLHLVYGSLATQARMIAAILPGPVQRPLRALLAAMNEHGKSYTKRSAKPRPRRSAASVRR
jgi:hypothetical protein